MSAVENGIVSIASQENNTIAFATNEAIYILPKGSLSFSIFSLSNIVKSVVLILLAVIVMDYLNYRSENKILH